MVWQSWGDAALAPLLLLLLLLAAAAAPLFCSGAGDVALISFSTTPRRVSRSASAAFAFRAVRASSGGPPYACGDCVITCQLDGETASNCGAGSASASAAAAWNTSRGGVVGNGTETASYAGLNDGNHAFTVCARTSSSSTSCATYAWDVDTVRPTASVSVEPAFTGASNVTALISFTEPCTAADGGFLCNHSHCHLIVYGPGVVDPSSLQVLSPGLRYSVTVTISPDALYGRLILVMARGFCTDAAGHRFVRTPNSTFTLHFDRRTDSMGITTTVPQKMLHIQGVTRMVQATNDEIIRVYLSFAQPVLNSSAQILSALTATGAILTPTNRSTLGNRRFGYVVNKISDTAIVSIECDAASIISRQGTPVHSAEPLTFLYDTRRPSVKLGTSTWRTSSRYIPVFIKFAKPVFNFSASAVQVAGGNVLSSHEASKSIYTLQIEAVDRLVSVQVAENAAQDVAENPNLASEPLQVRHYSVPASSSLAAVITTVIFAATAIVATLLTVSTSSLLASGAISRPSSYMISEPSRNILRMACHIQIFALARWLSVNLPIEYYEFAKGIEWSIPYMRLPWEGPAADPFLGYSTMPAIAYSELLDFDRSAVADEEVIPSDPALPTEFPGDGKPILPMQTDPGSGDGNKPVLPVQIPLDGKPLTAMEYRSFFENPDMKPEAQIIMKLQDLDGWKYFGRNMLWLGVMGGGLILLHLLALLYLRLRYDSRDRDRGHGYGYGALVLPRLEIMVVILALPCVSQAAAALIRGGTTGGLVAGVLLTAVLTSLLVGLLLFLSLGVTMGRLLEYKEEGQWTWKDPRRAACLRKLAPLFEDLRGPVVVTQQITTGGKRAGAGAGAPRPLIQKVLGVVRIYYTLLEWVKRVAVGMVAGAHASSSSGRSQAHAAVALSMASLQLLFLLLNKPFIKKRVQLVETLSVASEVLVLAACLALILMDDSNSNSNSRSGGGGVVGVAMLGAFALGFAAQVCNQWNALYRQARQLSLSADQSSFLDGAKTACLGLLLPSSSAVQQQQQDMDSGGGGGGGDMRRFRSSTLQLQPAGVSGVSRSASNSNERWWLRQLREMAKASFSDSG